MSRAYFFAALIYLFLACSLTGSLNSKQDAMKAPFKLKEPSPIGLQQDLPDDFPELIVNTLETPTKGIIFMECFQVSTPDANYIMLINEKGEVVWYNKPENQGVDFKMQGASTGIEIFFKELEGFTYNYLKVQRFDCAPLDPEFDGEAPVILQCKYFLEPQMITSINVEIRFDISKLPPFKDPSELAVFYRTTPNSGVFKKLETSLNESNQLVAITDSFGEFVIAFERQNPNIRKPVTIYPLYGKNLINNEAVKLSVF